MLNYLLTCFALLVILFILYIKNNEQYFEHMTNDLVPVANVDFGASNLSPNVPIEKHFPNCTDNKCTINNKISDTNKYNITGGNSLFVNIDKDLEIDPKKWKNKMEKIGCQKNNPFKNYNEPEEYFHINKIDFSEAIEENKRVSKTFDLNCLTNDHLYLSKYKEQRLNDKQNIIDQSWELKKVQDETNKNILNVDYRNAENFYKDLFEYKIGPMNMINWYLPSNYSDFSDFNDKTLDKKILTDKIPKIDKYRTRALNWHFGNPI